MSSEIYYEKWSGGKEGVIIFLHGWPGDSSKFESLAKLLKSRFTLYALDLPGWGKTLLKRTYNLEDYAKDVVSFIKVKKIKNPVIVGHSFGGRVGIKIAANYPEIPSKLFLIASAGIERKTFKGKIVNAVKGYIPFKKFLRKFMESRDYRNLTGEKRETFKNIVNENL
ncbi:MAG: alpha/beta hydrolase, partial [bacterium]